MLTHWYAPGWLMWRPRSRSDRGRNINQPCAYQCVSIQCSFYYTSFILLRFSSCSDISCLYIYTEQNINLLYNEVHSFFISTMVLNDFTVKIHIYLSTTYCSSKIPGAYKKWVYDFTVKKSDFSKHYIQ